MGKCYFFGLPITYPGAAWAGMNGCGQYTSPQFARSTFFLLHSHLGFSFCLYYFSENLLLPLCRWELASSPLLLLLLAFSFTYAYSSIPSLLIYLGFFYFWDSECVSAVCEQAVSVVRECVVSESPGSECTVIKCAVSASWAPEWCSGSKVLLWALGFCSLNWLPMSMWTLKSFFLLSCGCNCLFWAILSGLHCSLSSLLDANVYAVYKLGLCTYCLRVALGCFSKASTALICFFVQNFWCNCWSWPHLFAVQSTPSVCGVSITEGGWDMAGTTWSGSSTYWN